MDLFRKRNAPSPDGSGDGAPPSDPAPTQMVVIDEQTVTERLENRFTEPATATDANPPKDSLVHRAIHLFNIYIGLIIAGLVFFALADYSAYTAAEKHPGQLIYSNTMVQLWTACFRMAFVLVMSMVLIQLFRPVFQSMMSRFQIELTFFKQVCVYLAVFFGFCLLFVLLLSVNLPQTVSVGR